MKQHARKESSQRKVAQAKINDSAKSSAQKPPQKSTISKEAPKLDLDRPALVAQTQEVDLKYSLPKDEEDVEDNYEDDFASPDSKDQFIDSASQLQTAKKET